MNNNQGRVFNNSDAREKKPERYSKDSFVRELIGKVVKIRLVNGSELQGRLLEIGMYDILMQTSQARLIVMKSAIMTIEVV